MSVFFVIVRRKRSYGFPSTMCQLQSSSRAVVVGWWGLIWKREGSSGTAGVRGNRRGETGSRDVGRENTKAEGTQCSACKVTPIRKHTRGETFKCPRLLMQTANQTAATRLARFGACDRQSRTRAFDNLLLICRRAATNRSSSDYFFDSSVSHDYLLYCHHLFRSSPDLLKILAPALYLCPRTASVLKQIC